MANWTFLTHHGHVLVALVQDPDLTIDQISAKVGITSRATAGILNDLVEAGYVVKEKVGRNNSYTVNGQIPLRHPLNEKANVADLLALFK
jgi:DNA-binding MarR family transcriptional regulator